ncbi:hypothetical protein VPH35_082321 [Triticum aestivum]
MRRQKRLLLVRSGLERKISSLVSFPTHAIPVSLFPFLSSNPRPFPAAPPPALSPPSPPRAARAHALLTSRPELHLPQPRIPRSSRSDLDLRSTQEGRRGACAGGKGAWVRLMSTSAASQAKDAAAKAAKGDREKKEVAITSRTLFACSALLWFSRFDYVTGEGSPDRSPWKMFEWQGGPIILAQVETGTWSRRWAAAPSRTPTGPPRWSSPLTPACRG